MFGNGGLSCRCFSKSLADAVKKYTIKNIPEIFLPEIFLNGICPECNNKVLYRSKEVRNVNAVRTGIMLNDVVYQMLSI